MILSGKSKSKEPTDAEILPTEAKIVLFLITTAELTCIVELAFVYTFKILNVSQLQIANSSNKEVVTESRISEHKKDEFKIWPPRLVSMSKFIAKLNALKKKKFLKKIKIKCMRKVPLSENLAWSGIGALVIEQFVPYHSESQLQVPLP